MRDKEVLRKFFVLWALDNFHKPSTKDICDRTGIAEVSVKRAISSLRAIFGMRIVVVREDKKTYYTIVGWGVLNASKFRAQYNGYAWHNLPI
tara:strand:+ start:839 stop:1114 length:276 start_codon:yes stop_codon:yes gene_type:complete